jgi:hypothetical protein
VVPEARSLCQLAIRNRHPWRSAGKAAGVEPGGSHLQLPLLQAIPCSRELFQARTRDEDSVGATVALTLALDVREDVLLGAVVLVTLPVGDVLALAETEALAVMEALRVTLAERVAVAVRLAGDGVTVCAQKA